MLASLWMCTGISCTIWSFVIPTANLVSFNVFAQSELSSFYNLTDVSRFATYQCVDEHKVAVLAIILLLISVVLSGEHLEFVKDGYYLAS